MWDWWKHWRWLYNSHISKIALATSVAFEMYRRPLNGGNKFCTECKLRHMAVSRLEPREKNGGNFEKIALKRGLT
jgi:hypothetical protein